MNFQACFQTPLQSIATASSGSMDIDERQPRTVATPGEGPMSQSTLHTLWEMVTEYHNAGYQYNFTREIDATKPAAMDWQPETESPEVIMSVDTEGDSNAMDHLKFSTEIEMTDIAEDYIYIFGMAEDSLHDMDWEPVSCTDTDNDTPMSQTA